MKKKPKLIRSMYLIGLIILIVGAIDPLEGSILIAAGSILLALSTFLSHDPYWKFFLASMIMVISGVFALFYISSLGGFGDGSSLSVWWGALILPYPLGWLMSIIVLIIREVKKRKEMLKSSEITPE